MRISLRMQLPTLKSAVIRMKNMKVEKYDKIPIAVSFRGDRNYIQGSYLYAAVSDILKETFDDKNIWIDYIIFRKFIASSCSIILTDDKKSANKEICSDFTAQTGKTKLRGHIIETGSKIKLRVPFDEEKILSHAIIGGETILQKKRTEYHPIEEIVSLTKYLHNSLVPISNGKWIFSCLELSRPFKENENVLYKIGLKQNLANRMTISEIEEAGTLIGKIQFAVARI